MNTMELQPVLDLYSEVFIGIGIALAAVLFSASILAIAIRWSIFKKAGQKGWKALIPIYSDYIYYKIAWKGKVFVTLLLCSIGGILLIALMLTLHESIGIVIALLCGVAVAGANAVIGLKLHFKMAHAFGRSDYFAVGLYLLNGLFTAILAFGDAKYKGQKKFSKEAGETHEYARAARPVPPPAHPAQQRQPMYAEQQAASYAPVQQQTDYAYQPRAQYQPAAQRPVRRAARNIDQQE